MDDLTAKAYKEYLRTCLAAVDRRMEQLREQRREHMRRLGVLQANETVDWVTPGDRVQVTLGGETLTGFLQAAPRWDGGGYVCHIRPSSKPYGVRHYLLVGDSITPSEGHDE